MCVQANNEQEISDTQELKKQIRAFTKCIYGGQALIQARNILKVQNTQRKKKKAGIRQKSQSPIIRVVSEYTTAQACTAHAEKPMRH